MNWVTVGRSSYTGTQSMQLKRNEKNKINADHLHCGDKRLNRGQHRPKS